MKLIKILTALSIALALNACSGIKTSVDYDESFDFSGISSWNWLHAKQPETGDRFVDNTLRDGRIRRSIGEVLKEKGQDQKTSAPDVLIAYEFSVETRQKTSSVGVYVGTGTWGNRGGVSVGAGGPVSTRSTPYQVGTLIIDVINPADEQLLWRGSGQATLQDSIEAGTQDQDMLEAIRKIMENYPPARKSKAS